MTNKFIGRQEHTSAFYGFIRQNDGTLIYVKSNDDNISLQTDDQEEVYTDYFIGISDGEFVINERGQLVFKY